MCRQVPGENRYIAGSREQHALEFPISATLSIIHSVVSNLLVGLVVCIDHQVAVNQIPRRIQCRIARFSQLKVREVLLFVLGL